MLEKILEEIIEQLKAEGCIIDNDAGHRAVDIIRKHTNDGWIPVEERLPDENGYYRVTVRNTELEEDIMEETAWFAHVDDYDMDKSEWRELCWYEEVIAWRELAPYRPERSRN